MEIKKKRLYIFGQTVYLSLGFSLQLTPGSLGAGWCGSLPELFLCAWEQVLCALKSALKSFCLRLVISLCVWEWVLVGVAAFLASEVVLFRLSPVVPHLGMVVGSCGSLLGLCSRSSSSSGSSSGSSSISIRRE